MFASDQTFSSAFSGCEVTGGFSARGLCVVSCVVCCVVSWITQQQLPQAPLACPKLWCCLVQRPCPFGSSPDTPPPRPHPHPHASCHMEDVAAFVFLLFRLMASKSHSYACPPSHPLPPFGSALGLIAGVDVYGLCSSHPP